MGKNIFAITIAMGIGLSCIDVGQMGLFSNKYGEVENYDFSGSLVSVPSNQWRFIPKEFSNCPDAIFIKAQDSTGFHNKLAIFFYGTGYNLYYSAQIGKLFRGFGINFLSTDYYGFGRTAKSIKPSEEMCYQGGVETLQYAIDSLGFNSKDIILCGFSLGTGIAVEMAIRYHIGAVLLFAPFLNTDAVVKTVSGGYDIPRDWFLDAKFDNGSKISKISAPLCMFAGENDCLIVPENMNELYKKANNPKFQYVLSGEDHPDFPSDSYQKWKDLVLLFFKSNINN